MSQILHSSGPWQAFVAPARAHAGLWRLLLGFVLIVIVYLGLNASAFGLLALLRGGDVTRSWASQLASASTPAGALALLATFVPLTLGPLLAVRWIHRRPMRSLLGPLCQCLRDFFRAALIVFGLFALSLVAWGLRFDPEPNLAPGLWLTLLPISLLGILCQTLSEELLFRGYLQQQLAARFVSKWIWGLLPALAFGALHWDPARMGDAAPYIVAGAFIFGLIAADLTVRTGNLGAAWGLHFANNTLAIAGLATQGTITGLALWVTPYAPQEIALSPVLALVDLLPLLITWILLRHLVRG